MCINLWRHRSDRAGSLRELGVGDSDRHSRSHVAAGDSDRHSRSHVAAESQRESADTVAARGA